MDGLKTYISGRHYIVDSDLRREITANIQSLDARGIFVPLSFDVIRQINLLLIPIKKDGKIGFINKVGKIVCDIKYDEYKGVCVDGNNVIAVKKENKWSVINSEGVELLPFDYTLIFPSKDSMLVSAQNKKGWQVINAGTKDIIVPIRTYELIEGFRFGFARVKNKGLWGVISETGKLVLDTEYTDLLDFYTNWDKPETKVKKPSESKWQYINLNELNKQQ